MRFLHTNAGYWPFVGGAETYLQAMCERLARDRHTVHVATTDAQSVQCFWDPRLPRATPPESELNGVRIVRSRVAHLPFSPWSFYLLRRAATDLARLPRLSRPVLERLARYMPHVPDLDAALERIPAGIDLVHGVNISLEWPLLAGRRYARRHGLPFVATPFVHVGVREVERFYTMPHQMAALQDADRVFVQTEIEGRELARLGVPAERIVLLGMGIDPEATRGGDRDRFRAEHGIDGAVITFMGALTDDKGVVHLLRAMQPVWADTSPVTLVLAGPTVSPSTFEREFGALPDRLRARIRRLGVVTGPAKQDMLAASDLLVLPSRVDSFGIVFLEAWAYGLPVIGCRAGGVPDVIDDGQDGLLVPFGDIAALAGAIASLLGSPDRRQAMGSRGKAKVEARYTWESIYTRLWAVYQDLVGSWPWLDTHDGVARRPGFHIRPAGGVSEPRFEQGS